MLKRNLYRRAVCLGLGTLLLQSAGAEVRYWAKDVGLPGSQTSYYRKINNAGQAIGSSEFVDPVSGAVSRRCFLYSGGVTNDIGTLGGDYCDVQSINSLGDVIGTASLTGNNIWHPFLYRNGVMTDLEVATGLAGVGLGDINDAEEVSLNSSDDNGSHVWLYSNGSLIELGATGLTTGQGQLNNVGEVVAYVYPEIVLASGGAVYNLGSLGGGNTSVNGWNHSIINDAGEVIGQSVTDTGEFHGFIYQYGMMTDIGTLGGSSWFEARGINQLGEGFGNAPNIYERMHAFLYTEGSLKDMGTQGGIESCNHDINNYGDVVGHSKLAGDGSYLGIYDSGPNYIYTNGRMYDLNTLVSPDNGFIYASYDGQINDNGQIFIPGFDAENSEHAVLLTPLPVTTATLAGTKDISGWYTTNVTVSLRATDAVTGVKSISYSLDGTASRRYRTPIRVTTIGTHTITFQATDKQGHVESTKKVTFSIKKPGFLVTSIPQDGTVGAPYTQTLASTGGIAPVTWALTSGKLPPGLTLTSTGVISGTPSESGTYSFTVKATDKTRETTTSYLTITMLDPLTITTPATAGMPVIGLTASGGKEPYTWRFDPAYPLPDGLLLEDASVSSAAALGSSFGVIATDSRGISVKKTITLTTVDPNISVSTTGATSVKTGSPVAIAFSATGGASGPFTWTADPSSTLPAGLNLNPTTGVVSGTATAFGTIALFAIDSAGNWSNPVYVPFEVN